LTATRLTVKLEDVALLSRSDFSKAAHVSKPAVTKAVTAGRLVLNTSGQIDTYHPTNAAYLASRIAADAVAPPPPAPAPSLLASATKVRAPKSDTVPPPPVRPPKPPASDPDDIEGMAIESMSLDTRKKKTQIDLMRSQTRKHDLFLAEKKNELIPRDLVRRKYSAFDAALKTHLRDMPRRISAQIAALAASGGRPAVEAALEAEISSSLARIVQAAKEQDLTT